MGNTELSCGMSCLKYLLFVVNFIVWVCGIVVLGVGIYSRVKAGDWSDLMKDASIIDAANLLIASGAIVMVIGFFGCCGAVKQNRPLLVIYIILLLLIFILEIAGGIYAAVKKDDVLKSLQDGFQETIQNSYGIKINTNKANKELTESVDWFQENVKCCGSDGPSSWKNTKWANETVTVVNGTVTLVPASCCKTSGCDTTGPVDGYASLTTVYTNGCIKESEEFLNDHTKELVGVGVGIAFIQVIGIVFAILLCRAIGQESV